MFNIMIENENKERTHVWQNSWGLTTRTIGVMVMVHGDDKGLVLPPRVAAIQAVIVPVGITAKTTDEDKKKIEEAANNMALALKKAGIKVKADTRDNYTPGWKYNHWEVKGVPLRLEIGPKDLAKNETRAVRRDNGAASSLSLSNLGEQVHALLETIQSDMFARAKAVRDERLVKLESWDNFVSTLDKRCMVLTPWCERVECEEEVKDRSAKEYVIYALFNVILTLIVLLTRIKMKRPRRWVPRRCVFHLSNPRKVSSPV
jgi:prolyl-tRNA synthetase